MQAIYFAGGYLRGVQEFARRWSASSLPRREERMGPPSASRSNATNIPSARRQSSTRAVNSGPSL